MKRGTGASLFTLSLLGFSLLAAPAVQAQSSFFTAQCASCHTGAGVTSTCNGCHHHGNSSLAAVTNKSSYAPGESVTATLSGGSKSGWIRAVLYDQTGAQIAISSGNASGMGSSTTFPAALTAPAPATAGTYTWKMAYFGNADGSGHSEITKNITFTVAAAAVADTTPPMVSAFTLPATAATLRVPVSALAATDNVGVTGYLITTSATVPSASASGWSAAVPSVAIAGAAGNVTFYAWAKDAAGNISVARSAAVSITISTADTTPPTLTVSTLADNSYSNSVTLNVSGVATDAGGLASVTVNGQAATVNADGSFSTAVALTLGVNTITVIATDAAGNSSSITRTITYDATAPVLAITSPADNSTSATSSITVSGTVSESSTVTVSVNGGSPQSAIKSGGAFTSPVSLVAGINTIDINATDQAGNSSSAKRTVTYTAAVSQLSLAVTTPPQDVTTGNSAMTVKGAVAGASGKVQVTVTVNNRSSSVKVNADGSFSWKVTFSKGQLYVIKVSAKDAAGNSASVTRNVIYRPQVKHDDNNDD